MINKDTHLTDKDFETMGWHDCRIYGIKFPNELFSLTLDIDYIFKWIKSVSTYTGFWVSPCELTFIDVFNFKIDIDFANTNLLFIKNIYRDNNRISKENGALYWDYTIECDEGEITFSSTGFVQIVKSSPILSESLDLGRA